MKIRQAKKIIRQHERENRAPRFGLLLRAMKRAPLYAYAHLPWIRRFIDHEREWRFSLTTDAQDLTDVRGRLT